ncbi:MAG: acetylglutamate kinase [Acidimicrobiales bacterium]
MNGTSETGTGAAPTVMAPVGMTPGVIAPGDKAAVLVESLPYIRRFWGQVVVVKYGGNVLRSKDGGPDVDEGEALASFAEDIVLMRSVGMLPVVVHGGGPQIGALMERVGKVPEFRDGFRVTDADTIDLVRMVLVGKVNRDIVGAINIHGALAVGLSGEDANLITATARSEALGFVGDVVEVDPVIIHQLLAQGLIPVVATIGTDETGQAFNINADTAAGALAAVLGSEKLVYLTDVSGIRAVPDDPSTLIHQITADGLDELVASGAANGGMIPKAEACARAVRAGVRRAHILDGRTPHALLLEILTDQGVGTMVSARPEPERGSTAAAAADGPTGHGPPPPVASPVPGAGQ